MWNGSIADLAACDASPTSDGLLKQWVDGQQAGVGDVPALTALLAKADPHLQEAAIELATAAPREVVVALEPALAAAVRPGVDTWVIEALAGLLELHVLPAVIAALARHHIDERAHRQLPTTPPAPPTRLPPAHYILRNRLPQPWLRLEDLYARLALAAGDHPTACDLAYLPVLEARLGTRGWPATLARLRDR